ncbi:MAG: DUF4870 domain-containing protein [Clostridiales bacterium]|nr:DUF4870 domain-containing protein [Clostridiales bacterium]
MTNKSVFGLDEKIAGLLSYALTFITGIFFYVMERENKFVRFHALQSTVWFLALTVAGWVLGLLSGIAIIGGLFAFVRGLLGLLSLVSWVYLMYMAYKGSEFKIPILGDAVWNQVNK